MINVRILKLGWAAICVFSIAGCSSDDAANADAASAGVADAAEALADAAIDANPCPDGQVLVEELCVTPTTSGSPFLCTIPPFEPCGGDLVGTWDYVDACETNPHYNQYSSSCGDLVVSHFFYIDYDGTLSFTEGGNYSDSYTPTTYSVSDMALSCGGYYNCGTLGGSWNLGTCVPEGDDRCACIDDANVGDSESSSDSYTVSGNEVTFRGDSMGSPYCIQGDILYINRVQAKTYEPLKLQRQQ